MQFQKSQLAHFSFSGKMNTPGAAERQSPGQQQIKTSNLHSISSKHSALAYQSAEKVHQVAKQPNSTSKDMIRRKMSNDEKIETFESQIDELAQHVVNLEISQRVDKKTPPINKLNFVDKTNIIKSLYQQFLTKNRAVTSDNIEDAIKNEKGKSDFVIHCSYEDCNTRALSVSETTALLEKVCIVKLSGGLGTSMKCPYPKAFIEIRPELCIMDLCFKQINHYNNEFGVDIPLALMTSFHTRGQMESGIKHFKDRLRIDIFEQSAMPRINAETHVPLPNTEYSTFNTQDWYPPGHGDFYTSFMHSGLLDKYLAAGKEWAFVSNIDNLGAHPDPQIIAKICDMHSDNGADFVAEVTPKTLSDIKGGIFIRVGKEIRLVESSQIPEEYVGEFKGASAFKFFNTNNLWIHLPSLKKLIESNSIYTDVISNVKNLENNLRIIQLESAISSAICSFKNPKCLEVSRQRFMPIKNCEDLMPLLGKLIQINADGFCHQKALNLPLIKLGKQFKSLVDFNERVSKNIDITKLLHLTVSGDVNFGKNITLKGNVIIIAPDGSHICIPDNSVLENKVITGNLSIYDH